MQRFKHILVSLLSRKGPAVALGVVGLYVVVGLTARWIAPHDPLAIHEAFLQPPSPHYPMGTDQLGRDVLSRVMYGAGISLRVAGLSVGLALVVGVPVGLVAGYFGGWIDTILSRLMDVMFALPAVLLALVVMAVIGVGLSKVTLAIGVVYAPIFARVCRGAVLRTRAEPYIEAARAQGMSHLRIMARHVLPGAVAPLTVQTTLSLAFAILAAAALSFLGLAGEADTPSWGLMLRSGKDLMELAWWVAVFPGLAITAAVLALNILGDGLRDTLDPRPGS